MRRTADDQREEGAAGTQRERACPTQPRICSYPCCLFRTVPRAPFSSPHSLSSADACWLAGADAGSLARSLACRIDGKGEICVREDEESEGSEGTIGGKESDRNGEKVSHPDRISPTSLAPFSLCLFSCSRAALSRCRCCRCGRKSSGPSRSQGALLGEALSFRARALRWIVGWARARDCLCGCVWRLFQRGSSASASSGASSLVLALVAFVLLVLLTRRRRGGEPPFSFPFSRREFGGCEVEGFH